MKKIKDTHRYLTVSYAGYDTDIDAKIVKAVGSKYESGSGCGFGCRDINFIFEKNATLRKAVDRVLKLKEKLPKEYRQLEIEGSDIYEDEVE